jgi:hypothetical protein
MSMSRSPRRRSIGRCKISDSESSLGWAAKKYRGLMQAPKLAGSVDEGVGRYVGLILVFQPGYDALIGACARKMKAEIIYTWNIAHFLGLGEEVADKVRTP